jgi:hypothetical protein
MSSFIEKKKRQEYFELCKKNDGVFNKTHAYFEKNKYYLEFDQHFANQCLIACIQADNWNDFYDVFTDLIVLYNYCEIQQCLREAHDYQWTGCTYIHDIPLHYILHITCLEGYQSLFQKVCQKIHKHIPRVIERCFFIALENKFSKILTNLAKKFPQQVYIVSDFNRETIYYYTRKKEEIQKINRKKRQINQMFLLWLISSNSPKQDCIWYQLPHDISRYIIQQFI